MKALKIISMGILLGLLNTVPAVSSSAAVPAVSAGVAFPSFADLVERLMPSVVNISTRTKPEDDSQAGGEEALAEASPEFHRYFENGRKQEALGSGFIIDEEGYIITNNHVIADAEKINVTLSDDTTLEARIIGKDYKTDIALIKIDTDRKLSPVTFGDSDKIRVGDWILAIGNPFGLGGSVTAGIVSAKSRDIEAGQYDNFIQTDASINQGSSGGPMFNMQGEVIGINSVIFSTNGASMGIGFAIPINLADWVIAQLKQYGEIRRGWIGIKIQPNETETPGVKGGVLVSDVTVGAPAQRAGIFAGDIILEFNGIAVKNTKDFSRRVAEAEIGKPAAVTVLRDNKKEVLALDIEKLPEENPAPLSASAEAAVVKSVNGSEYFLPELGVKISPVSPALAQLYGISPESTGMVITDIHPGTDAAAKGLKKGNVIVKIDKKDVTDIESVKNHISEAKMEHNRPVLVLFQDGDAVHFAALKLQKGTE